MTGRIIYWLDDCHREQSPHVLKVRALSRVLGYYHSRSVLAAILRLGIIGRLEVLVRSREFDTAHFPRECAVCPRGRHLRALRQQTEDCEYWRAIEILEHGYALTPVGEK